MEPLVVKWKRVGVSYPCRELVQYSLRKAGRSARLECHSARWFQGVSNLTQTWGIITRPEGNRSRKFVTKALLRTPSCDLGINFSLPRSICVKYRLTETQDRTGLRSVGGRGVENFILALELLGGCGMILRAKLLRTSPTDGRCHRADRDSIGPLTSRVHPSSVKWCNRLNLSRGLSV